MKILFLTQIVPYPIDAGPKVRIYYVLRYLAQFHQVTLVSFTRGEKESAQAEHLRTFCHAVHTVPIYRSPWRDVYFLSASLVSDQPFLIARDHVPPMHALIRDLIAQEKFDVVHADQLGMAQYAVGLPGVKVLDQHNAVWTIVHRLWQNAGLGLPKLLMRIEWRKLQRYEARTCQQFDHVFTVTEQDQRALQVLDSNAKFPVTVMPICIDPAAIPPIPFHPDAKNIICVGGMFYPPNVDGVLWFAKQVFPQIKPAYPEAQFLVVGARPAKALMRAGDADPRILVTGYVEDTDPYLRASAVFIVPLRAGGGMRVKILDAWARGIPIVSTTIGCEGIEVRPEENILIADTPADFANAVARALGDVNLRRRLSENGRWWVEAKYNWRSEYRRLDQVYARMLTEKSVEA